jgi:hypothetical protein
MCLWVGGLGGLGPGGRHVPAGRGSGGPQVAHIACRGRAGRARWCALHRPTAPTQHAAAARCWLAGSSCGGVLRGCIPRACMLWRRL